MISKIKIAQIGKTVGLKGDLKLNLFTDFPEQFKKGRVFLSDKLELEIESFNKKRNLIKFVGFNDIDEAKKLTNRFLYSNEEDTRENCNLKKDEYFYFDIIGSNIIEYEKIIGTIKEIDDIAGTNYFIIETHKDLIEQEYAKTFMLPYLDKFIEKVDIENREVYAKGALEILKNS